VTSPRLASFALVAAALSLATCGGGGSSGKTFVHAAKFVVSGSHQTLACSDCHDPSKPTFSLAGGGVDCLHCHTQTAVQPAHSGVGGFAYDNASCIGCHKNGTGLPPNHDAQLFPVTSTSHAAVACSQCHGATRAPADLQCASCHDHDQATMATKHAAIPSVVEGITNYQWSSGFCVRCHADGQVNRISSHPRDQSGINGNHQPWCLNCHGIMRTDKAWGADFTRTSSANCDACHTARGVRN
jgi:hypothetical protein